MTFALPLFFLDKHSEFWLKMLLTQKTLPTQQQPKPLFQFYFSYHYLWENLHFKKWQVF